MAIPVMWRNKKARYSLQGDLCQECARLVFPPRRVCPYCGREAEVHAAVVDTPRYEFAFVLPQMAELRIAGDD